MNREHDQAALHRNETPEATVTALELLANEPITDAIQSGASIAINRAAEQTEFGNLGYQFTRKPMLFECFAHDGDCLLVNEAGDRILNHAFVVREF